MKHYLKILPQYFCRIEDGTKTFEVRKNDRGFQPGDIVVLKEWDATPHSESGPGGNEHYDGRYTGREIKKKVGYLYPIVGNDRVVFSLLEDN